MPLIITPPWEPLGIPYTINEHRFWRFHRANLHVYTRICERIQMKINVGWTIWGLKAVIEDIRWEDKNLRTTAEKYKFSNSFTPYYARLWLRDHQGTNFVFRTRALTSRPVGIPNIPPWSPEAA